MSISLCTGMNSALEPPGVSGLGVGVAEEAAMVRADPEEREVVESGGMSVMIESELSILACRWWWKEGKKRWTYCGVGRVAYVSARET